MCAWYKHAFNASFFPKKYEVNRLPSMTVPDQSMSIKELVTRYAQGLPLEGERVPIYNGEDDDMPDLTHMDLADREAYMLAARQELDEIKEKLNKKAAEQKKAQQGTKFQRTTGDADDVGTTDQPDPPKAEQYPKKTRGGGAEPPDTRKSGDKNSNQSKDW